MAGAGRTFRDTAAIPGGAASMRARWPRVDCAPAMASGS